MPADRLPAGPHRRYNPLNDEWVLVSPQRLERPWQGLVEAPEVEPLPRYDPACYLCPGNERAGGARNPAYTSTFAFDNDFPALLQESPAQGRRSETPPLLSRLDEEGVSLLRSNDGLLVARAERGVCRVLCFTPRHDLSLARMALAEIRGVVEAWAEESAALGARDGISYVQLFENKGELMGCSNPHPHCQLWATERVPTRPARTMRMQRAYHETHRRDLLGDYLEREIEDGSRLVCANEHWVALVPFWAVWPFETMLLPRRRVEALRALSAAERDALADVMKRLTVRYDNLFRCSFPYSMGWHGSPADGKQHASLRLHASYLPPLLRSASVKKFLVGYELTSEPQRDLTPEAAAARLRAQEERHYQDAAG